MLGPSPHALKNQAIKNGFNHEYVEKLNAIAKHLHTKCVPVVFSLMHLAHLTKTQWTTHRQIISRDFDPYTVFTISKRSGGRRRICVPDPALKLIQKWIHTNILCSPGAIAMLHQATQAYAPKSSILKNANKHAGAAWIVKVDITDFFESVSERQVYYVFRNLGYTALLSFELARLCTRIVPSPTNPRKKRQREKMWRWTNHFHAEEAPYEHQRAVGHLPQGAPTSAMLANLAVVGLDREIQTIADEAGATYTRYADDIVLSLGSGSRSQCEEIFAKVTSAVSHSGFRVNRGKSCVRGPGARKIVTGLVVNDAVPRLPRATKEKIQTALYHIKKHGLMSHAKRQGSNNPMGYLNHLVGKIYFSLSIEPEFGKWAFAELRDAVAPNAELIEILQGLGAKHAQDQAQSYMDF